MAKPRSYKDLESKWYKKIKDGGFEDIEDTSHPQRPLKEWHSLKAASKRYRRIRDTSYEYQDKIENFLNHITFAEACRFITKSETGRPCQFDMNKVREIWIMHTQGVAIRRIAKDLKTRKSAVFRVLEKLREWMKYLS